MNCENLRPLLEAHADGELDLVRQIEVDTHLAGCAACSRLAAEFTARREALEASLPRFAAPAALRQAILASVRGHGTPANRPRAASRGRLIPRSAWNLGGLAASLAVALALGYGLGGSRARTNSLLDEAVADHVRSLQAGHLTDVVSTDQHTVKPWFIGRVDFSPPVVDLGEVGFPLVGGRLERIDGQTAAALVYHRRLHTINVFIWPDARGAIPSRLGAKDGYHTVAWSQGGLNFLAISEIPGAELQEFVGAYRDR